MTAPKPVPGKRYTPSEMEAMRQAYPDMVIPGHVMRIDADGMFTIVPEKQAAGAFGRGDALRHAYRSNESVRELFPTPPIVRRTPAERLESLAASLRNDAIQYGFPGLTEEWVQDYIGRSWAHGQPVAAEDVRALAARLLTEAERKNEAAEAKKIVRTAPSD